MNSLTATKPKLGFLGLGWIGKNRLMAIKDNQSVQIGAIADPNPAAIEDLKQEIEGVAIFDTLDPLLREDLDGIVISTPSALHAKQSIKALKSGKAVFCQKPLGISKSETASVVNVARKQNRLLKVDFSYRYTQAAKEVRKVIQSGELGNIYSAELIFHNAYGPDKSWYYDASLSGGGCLIDLGIHLIDMVFWVLGKSKIQKPCTQFFTQGQPLHSRQKHLEDYLVAQFSVHNTTAVQLSCSWNMPAGKEAIIKVAFYGEDGGVAYRNVNGSFYDFTAEKYIGTTTQSLTKPPDDWSSRALTEWIKRISEDRSFDPAAEEYISVAHAIDILYKSSF